MELKKVSVDLGKMSKNEFKDICYEVESEKCRRDYVDDYFHTIERTLRRMHEDNKMVLVNNTTGEVFNLSDWVIYCEKNDGFYSKERDD